MKIIKQLTVWVKLNKDFIRFISGVAIAVILISLIVSYKNEQNKAVSFAEKNVALQTKNERLHVDNKKLSKFIKNRDVKINSLTTELNAEKDARKNDQEKITKIESEIEGLQDLITNMPSNEVYIEIDQIQYPFPGIRYFPLMKYR